MKSTKARALRYVGRGKVKECIEAIRKFAAVCKEKGGAEAVFHKPEYAKAKIGIYSFGTGYHLDDEAFNLIAQTILENRIEGMVIYVETDAATIAYYDTARRDTVPYTEPGGINPRVVARVETIYETALRKSLEEKERKAVEEAQKRDAEHLSRLGKPTYEEMERIVKRIVRDVKAVYAVRYMLPAKLRPAYGRIVEYYTKKERN